MPAPELSGAEIIVQALTDLGVDTLFGYPGGAVLPIYDALFKQRRIRHIQHRPGSPNPLRRFGLRRALGEPAAAGAYGPIQLRARRCRCDNRSFVGWSP